MDTRPRTRAIPTWEMTREELARTWAAHYGYAGRSGGWIYSPDGRPVAHGWAALAAKLAARGAIATGKGVNWRAADLARGPAALVR